MPVALARDFEVASTQSMQIRNNLGRLNGEYQRLTEVAGFQDLLIADRSVATMRHDVAGLTLYARTGQETDCAVSTNRHNFTLAFESEEANCEQIEFVVLKTNDAHTVWRVLEMINQHAHRIQREISLAAQDHCSCKDQHCGGAIIGPVNVMSIGKFDAVDTREAVELSLTALTGARTEDRYVGFVRAVCSTVDAWLASQSLWASAAPCPYASRPVEPRDEA